MFGRNHDVASSLMQVATDLSELRTPGYLEALEPEATVSNWYLSPIEVLSLRGNVKCHPRLRDGPFESSQLFYFNKELHLARTLSRWYRLEDALEFRRGNER